MLSGALHMVLIGFGVKTVVACNLYSDCSVGCETNPDTSLLECAELDGVGGFIFATRPITTAESMAGVGSPCPQSNTTRYCYCNLDMRGGTCMYGNRGIPATDLPTLRPTSSTSMLPSSSQSPSISAKPSVSGEPSVSASPSTSYGPSASVAPSTTIWPTTSLRPSKSAQPTISVEPSISTSPSVSSNPSVSAQPSVSLAPSSTGSPTSSAHPSVSSSPTDEPSSSRSPSVSSQPSATITPSTTEWPTHSQRPSASSQPSISSEEPSFSRAPSRSQGPSVSARPSVSAGPSISSAPSTTTRPTNSQRPSVSAKPTSIPTPSPVTNNPTVSHLGIKPNLPAECAGKCPNKEIDPVLGRHDCGWGIWNDCTCQCVCDPGVCLSANSKCYDGCTTHLDFNPYGGCIPGVDCPWYRSKLGEPHCESSANFAGIHALRETAELCCKLHFRYVDLATCVQNSKADVVAEEAKVAQDLARSKYYYPDMHGKQNCVFDSNYEDWMAGPNKEHLLFESSAQCCGNWYPSRTDCPDTTLVTPKQLDYKPDASKGYFYPHLSESNCRYGRNYPMWMKISPKHYLYTTPEECCRTWYPSELNCPLKEDDGVQEGFFWIVDTAYYPNWKGGGCALGNDYPEWMADPTQRDTHLFESAKQCCDLWFRSTSTKCQQTIVVTSAGKQVPNNNGGTWYPSLNGKYLCINGTPPKWMEAEGYKDAYVFESHAECCKAHYCQDIRGIVQS